MNHEAPFGQVPLAMEEPLNYIANAIKDDDFVATESFKQELRKILLSRKEEDRVQIAKYIVNIENGTNITIGDENINKESIKSAFQQVLLEIDRNQLHISLRQYFKALNAFNRSPYSVLSLPEGKHLTDIYVDTPLFRPYKREFGDEINILFTNQVLQHTNIGQPLLILGQPGSGKSTLLHNIVLHAWDNPSSIGLQMRYIPMLIRLRYLAKVKDINIGMRLWKAIREAMDFTMSAEPPSDYFTAWPEIMKSKWLILLDGFDEIHPDYRSEVSTLIKTLQEMNCDIILTSRPSDSMESDLKNMLIEYDISPLDSEQQQELIYKLLNEDTDIFFSQLQQIEASDLAGTPLLLTIAAIVFKKEKKLPKTRVLLYQKFFDKTLEEAFKKDINEHLWHEFSSIGFARKILELIAYTMSINPDVSAKELEITIATYFSNLTGKSPDYYIDGEFALKQAITSLGERSGIFIYNGQLFSWLHPTFREYLTAVYINTKFENTDIAQFISKWNEDGWKQSILMLLALQSMNKDVSSYLDSIILENHPKGLFYAARCIAEGAQVSKTYKILLIDKLCDLVRAQSYDNICSQVLKRVDDVYSERAAIEINLFRNDPDSQQVLKSLEKDLYNSVINIPNIENRPETRFLAVFRDMGRLRFFKGLYQLYYTANLDDETRLTAAKVGIQYSYFEKKEPQAELSEIREIIKVGLFDQDLLHEVLRKLIHLQAYDDLKDFITSHKDHAPDIVEVIPSIPTEQLLSLLNIYGIDPGLKIAFLVNTHQRISPKDNKEYKYLNKAIMLLKLPIQDPELHLESYKALIDAIIEEKLWNQLFELVGNNKLSIDYRGLPIESLIAHNEVSVLLRLLTDTGFSIEAREVCAWFIAQNKDFVNNEDDKIANALEDAFDVLDCRFPKREMFIHAQAKYFFNKSKYFSSSICYDNLLELNPKNLMVRLERGHLFYIVGNYQQALNDFEYEPDYLATYPNYFSYHVHTLIDMNYYEKAIEFCEKAMNYDSIIHNAYALRGKCRTYQNAPDELDEALEDLEYSLELGMSESIVLYFKYQLHRKARNLKESLECLKDYLNEEDGSEFLQCAQVQLQVMLGDIELAEESINCLIAEHKEKVLANNENKEENLEDKLWRNELTFTSAFIHLAKKDVSGLNSLVSKATAELLENESSIHSWLSKNKEYPVLIHYLFLMYLISNQKDNTDITFQWMVEHNNCHNLLRQDTLPSVEDVLLMNPNDKYLNTLRIQLWKLLYSKAPTIELNRIIPDNVIVHEPYPIPMYCRQQYIAGLHEEYLKSNVLLEHYSKGLRSIALCTIDDPNKIYGHCNFPQSKEDKNNFKFSEFLSTILEQNLSILIQGYKAEQLLFTEQELMQKFKEVLSKKKIHVKLNLISSTFQSNNEVEEANSQEKTKGFLSKLKKWFLQS